jgi:hypothetical protein
MGDDAGGDVLAEDALVEEQQADEGREAVLPRRCASWAG